MTQPQMLSKHAAAFVSVARQNNVYLLVRRTNVASLKHIGDPACVPKRLDCKAKTADRPYVAGGYGFKDVAGLVVDPTIANRQAFTSDAKFSKALGEWRDHTLPIIHPAVRSYEGQRRLTYVPDGRNYFVDLDPRSPRYGCVKFTSSGLLSAGKYIHGDFDLYAIVRADDPIRNVALVEPEDRLGEKHNRSPEFLDIQIALNRQLGVPMVLHGAQESAFDHHTDEGIDVFHPDGKITGAENAAQIAHLYATTFRGRRLFTSKGSVETVNGRFVTPV